MDIKTDHSGKKHKPAKNHPWRQPRTTTIEKWARDKSESPKVNNFKIGGGKKQ